MKVTESGFIESNGFFYPKYPRQQVVEMLKYKQCGTALDIGAGFGNNTIPLLESGFEVTATETNMECVDELHVLSEKYPNKVHVIAESLEKLHFDTQFDAVACTMVLHFLNRSDALTAVKNMQEWTASDGVDVITSYTDYNSDMSEGIDFLLHKNELRELYSGWKIILYDEVVSGTQNPAGKAFQSAKLIAQKP
ncbi:MAG: methyltransferase domain-containing protein [Candidatus Saccharimonadales bacterium]